jgi:sulfur-carrier protein
VIRVHLPPQLRTLARVDGEVEVAVSEPVTLGRVLDAVEAAHPALAGTIRDRATGQRRPMVRLFADGEDLSDAPPSEPLPEAVRSGRQPFLVVGAIAGG